MAATSKSVMMVAAACVGGSLFAGSYTKSVENGVATLSGDGDNITVTEALTEPEVHSVVLKAASGAPLWRLTGANDYSGGTELVFSQLRTVAGFNFGTGPVTVSSAAILVSTELDLVDLPNKVILRHGGSVSCSGTERTMILHAIGLDPNDPDSTADGRFSFNHSSGAEPTIVLNLTGQDSEPINFFNLKYEPHVVVRGGTLKFKETAKGDAFRAGNGHSGKYPVLIDSPATAVDVASGGSVDFRGQGAPRVTISDSPDVVETLYPENWNFENGSTGWKQSATSGTGQNGTKPGVITSPDSTWIKGSVTTPDPSTGADGSRHVFMCRWGQEIEMVSKITFPADGVWRLRFYYSARSGDGGGDCPISVILDPGATTQCHDIIPARSNVNHGYLEYAKDYTFSAGETHWLRLRVNKPDGVSSPGFRGIAFDAVRFERIGLTPITKQGGGALALVDMTTTRPLSVEAGTLTLGLPDLATNGEITVAAGATLKLTDGNLVHNGSFEDDGDAVRDVQNANMSGWSRKKNPSTSVNANGAGPQGNGGNVSKTAPWTTAGVMTAALRQYTSIAQDVEIARDGDYTLSFSTARRAGYNGGSSAYAKDFILVVTLGGTEVYRGLVDNADVFRKVTVPLALTASETKQTLEFAFDKAEHDMTDQGSLIFVDDVRLCLTPSAAELTAGKKLSLATGSKLVLENETRLFAPEVFIDGVRFDGKRKALKRAGVLVEGEGDVVCGQPDDTGAVIILK